MQLLLKAPLSEHCITVQHSCLGKADFSLTKRWWIITPGRPFSSSSVCGYNKIPKTRSRWGQISGELCCLLQVGPLACIFYILTQQRDKTPKIRGAVRQCFMILMKRKPSWPNYHLKPHHLRLPKYLHLDGVCSYHSPEPLPDVFQKQTGPSLNRSPGHQRVNQAGSSEEAEAMPLMTASGKFKMWCV